MRCHLNLTVSTSQHSMWWHGKCLWCACSPFTTSSSKTITVVKFRRNDVFMRGHVSKKWDTNGWWPSAAATCCKTARQTTILMAACPQLMRRAVRRAIAWRRADTDSSSATSPENYTGDTEYTAGTLCRLQNKIQISRHFKIKFRPLAELDPTRPALSCKFSDPTRPDPTRPDPTRPAGRVKSRATLMQLTRDLLAIAKFFLLKTSLD